MTSRQAIKKLQFESINEALAQLNATDKGRYFLCECPECEKKEAFIYKNNLDFLHCNRENHCGERMVLKYQKKIGLEKWEEKQALSYPSLTKQQVDSLRWTTRLFGHVNRYFKSDALDRGYRGLSRETTDGFMTDLKSERLVSFFYQRIEPLIQKDYSKSSFMNKRNLVFPIYSDTGEVDRLLLRSSIDPLIEPKEIQLTINPTKETRDFIIDVSDESDVIVLSESIIDALSFREVDSSVGVIGLSGARKTRQIKEHLTKNKGLFENKRFILALDDDKAGIRARMDLIECLESEQIGKGYVIFSYPNNYKDANDFLMGDRELFELQVSSYLDKKVTRKVIEKQSVAIERS